ncbi:sialate O-acetylesterase [Sphingomonas sp.]|uniref:sialate O-acetylesterase n=1 Tax=Sphingomonas sp. TaxID=28214 RepID=UPI003D6D1959
MPAISPTVYTGPYTANGTQTEFSFNFSIVSAADIRVEIDSVAISSLLYTVEFGATGGTVTFAAAPVVGAQILLLSAPDYLQTSEFENEGAYNLATINTINRRASVKALVTEDKASRALKVPRGEEGLEIPLSDVASIVAVGESLLAGSDIPTVAGAVASIAAAAPHVGEIAAIVPGLPSIAAIAADITGPDTIGDVAGIILQVTQLAPHAAAVSTVAPHVAGINVAAANIAAIIAAPAAAAEATAQAAIATTAAATVNASITPIMYGRGAPNALTGGPNGATYIDTSSGRQYGPKAAGVWPTRFVLLGIPGSGYEPVTVVFMIGQSNADGFSTNYSTTTALAAGYGYEYYYNNGGFGAVLPLGPCRLGRTFGGPQSAFAQTWAAGGGGAVIFVDCAVGGSSMVSAYKAALTGTTDIASLSGGTWDLSDPANLYDNYIREHMQRALREIERFGFAIKKKIIYHSQGEQDALGGASQAAHEASFRPFATRVKADFPDIWWLTENLGTNQSGTNAVASTKIRASQAAVAADLAFSSWMKIGSTLAQAFSGLGYFSDTLHYDQTGYNLLGIDMATAGLAFTRSNGLFAVPEGMKYADLLSHLPPVNNWYRLALTTVASGAFNVSAFNDPATPYATTGYDTSGVNRVDATQSLAWTFPNANPKEVVFYAHVSTGATLAINAFTGNARIAAVSVIDEGFPLSGLNINGTNETVSGIVVTDADLYRLSGAKMREIGIGPTANFTAATLSNTLLAKLSGLTLLSLSRCPAIAANLDLTLIPNLTVYAHSASGLTVAQVNARLVALDANGKSGGSASLSQYLAGVYPHAVPTGAGATAKASLIAKGWSITTD